MPAAYVELHARSAFSFLEGASVPEDLVARAAALGYPAMALVDRDGVYGSPRFHMAAKKAGLRAHVGAEITTSDGARLPLLARTRAGYQNLCRLITRMKLGKLKLAPLDDLAEFSEGLISLTGPHFDLAERLLHIYGRDNVYIELQRHCRRDEEARNQAAIEEARRLNLPLVATNGVSHATPQERELLDVLTCDPPPRHPRHRRTAARIEQRAPSEAARRDGALVRRSSRSDGPQPWKSPRGSNSRCRIWATSFPATPCRRARRWTPFCESARRRARATATVLTTSGRGGRSSASWR